MTGEATPADIKAFEKFTPKLAKIIKEIYYIFNI